MASTWSKGRNAESGIDRIVGAKFPGHADMAGNQMDDAQFWGLNSDVAVTGGQIAKLTPFWICAIGNGR